MAETPLEAARAQLKHWQGERSAATNPKRIGQCNRFIRQCEVVIAALESAATPAPPAAG